VYSFPSQRTQHGGKPVGLYNLPSKSKTVRYLTCTAFAETKVPQCNDESNTGHGIELRKEGKILAHKPEDIKITVFGDVMSCSAPTVQKKLLPSWRGFPDSHLYENSKSDGQNVSTCRTQACLRLYWNIERIWLSGCVPNSVPLGQGPVACCREYSYEV
jgi:hypothetical protein